MRNLTYRDYPARELLEVVTIMKPVAVEDELEKKFLELQKLKRQYSLLNMIAGKIVGRTQELEKELTGLVKSCNGQIVKIEEATVTYSSRRTTSVSYKSVYLKALEICNDEQKKIIEEYKEVVTNKGLSESLKIIDPKLEAFIQNIKYATTDDLLNMMGEIKQIPDRPPEGLMPEGVVSDLAKSAWNKFKEVMKKIVTIMKAKINSVTMMFKRDKTVDDLIKLGKMKESYNRAIDLLNLVRM